MYWFELETYLIVVVVGLIIFGMNKNIVKTGKIYSFKKTMKVRGSSRWSQI